jgi:hypothetical protein
MDLRCIGPLLQYSNTPTDLGFLTAEPTVSDPHNPGVFQVRINHPFPRFFVPFLEKLDTQAEENSASVNIYGTKYDG